MEQDEEQEEARENKDSEMEEKREEPARQEQCQAAKAKVQEFCDA